ncbi:MAG: hypothetical protein SFX73_09290 [Kofleriaceae bacterium]|nr:hypothetical protein [Kofleriaceae bacterium]
MSQLHRWNHLARHGLLGAGLVAAAASPAAAEPCDEITATTVAAVIGMNISPKPSFLGGLELRTCIRDNADIALRLEFGGDKPRLIAAARAQPFHDTSDDAELLGIEAGILVDFEKRFGAHIGASYGLNVLYMALQADFPITGSERPARTSVVGAAAPWSFATQSTAVPGRPLVTAGQLHRPAIASLPHLASAEDRAVRDHFASAAQLEYSSVWTFLRLAAELAAVGAPARLVAAALDAADDEVRHAELCAAVAGVTLSPLALAAAQPRFTQRTPAALAQLAEEAWLEGCLNEGAAAEEARAAASETTDAARAAMLATIARDEQGHAELSWQVLAWLFEVAPDVASSAITSAPAFVVGEGKRDDAALARQGVPSSRVTMHARAVAARVARARLAAL